MLSRDLLSLWAVPLLLFLLAAAPASCGSAPGAGTPWPMPQKYETLQKFRYLEASNFIFTATRFTCDVLEQAFTRYYGLVFDQATRADRFLRFNSQKLRELLVELENPCEKYPSLESDESYTLVIDEECSELKAKSIWGALRGLETFSQLVHKEDGRLVVKHTKIEDFPRFAWRGVLLDSSRHFLPLETILRSLDALSFNKMNVFHWHIVDDQSFPYESYTFPNISLKGSYNPYTHVYTQANVAHVIEYARMRGIRVVVEFDSPGHMRSWEKGQPGLLTQCFDKEGKPNGHGPLDPSKDSSFEFMQKFFKEISEVFPDRYIHLGGDEVEFDCWASNDKIRQFMKKIGIPNNYRQLESYYVEKALQMVEKLNKSYIVWQEVFDDRNKVDPSTVIHVWKWEHLKELRRVTGSGLRAILSSPWYINYISTGAVWRGFYGNDPHEFSDDPKLQKLVMGGEACMWGEFVDATDLHSRLWPSASAVAERLWSPREVRNIDEAEVRINEHRCRMLRRGIMAGPASGPGYCEVEADL